MKISVQHTAPFYDVQSGNATVQTNDGGFSVTFKNDDGIHGCFNLGDTIMIVDGDETLKGVVLSVTRTTLDDAHAVIVDAKLAA
ncbi:hypothetical protein [Paraburkholderia haematera]|uniref:Uncharacterized protein n=1 Tax=Paraburkholderia haematera TaxID=2793077 RepID=A0ABN7KYT7_9BURK|nr:hypothetical protein [Paraburkholderia haematera]CAE6714380.1 hypothetical protein R69888_01302 [Paraburkholderia haematera]